MSLWMMKSKGSPPNICRCLQKSVLPIIPIVMSLKALSWTFFKNSWLRQKCCMNARFTAGCVLLKIMDDFKLLWGVPAAQWKLCRIVLSNTSLQAPRDKAQSKFLLINSLVWPWCQQTIDDQEQQLCQATVFAMSLCDGVDKILVFYCFVECIERL